MKYRNNSQNVYSVYNTDNHTISVKPGEYVDSYVFYDYEDFDVIDDYDDLYNPITAITEVSLGAATDHVLHADTKKILIIKVTDTITVRPQVDTAVPLLLNMTVNDPIIVIERERNWYTKLRVSGSGTCTIMEYR